MGLEVEHKFLVKPEKLPRRLPAGERLEQGYLGLKPTVRVRIVTPPGKPARAYLTIKGPGLRERAEYEYPIPPRDAKALLKLCGEHVIRKTRRCLGPWELDEFAGRHKGLWLAEVELATRRQKLPALPEWVGAEVTADPRYSNAYLSCHPYPLE